MAKYLQNLKIKIWKYFGSVSTPKEMEDTDICFPLIRRAVYSYFRLGTGHRMKGKTYPAVDSPVLELMMQISSW